MSASAAAVTLVVPGREHLPGYAAALRAGWTPDNARGLAAAADELRQIEADPDRFLASLVDREARGPAIQLPDGTVVKRLPGIKRWIWDGELCGSVGFRWQPGTEALPPHCLGHVGYAVVPWKRGRGYATRALALMLPLAAAEGLRWIELTTDTDNLASQRVIEANGGVLHERFVKPAAYGGMPGLKYRIYLG